MKLKTRGAVWQLFEDYVVKGGKKREGEIEKERKRRNKKRKRGRDEWESSPVSI